VAARRKKVRGWVVAALVPLMFAIVVDGAFGAGWAGAFLPATYLVYVPFALGERRHVDWLISRRLGLFLLFCYLVYCWTVLVLTVTATAVVESRAHWSAWLCLGMSVLVSALATGALWPVQLWYYARLRASRRVRWAGPLRRGPFPGDLPRAGPAGTLPKDQRDAAPGSPRPGRPRDQSEGMYRRPRP
jgi:hypothetical protein